MDIIKGFEKPTSVEGLDLIFGGNIKKLLPEYEDIPDEFKMQGNYWVRWQQKWFFSGLSESDVPQAKEGIDLKAAMQHLASIQRSFEPKHEHKEAGVAYLATIWFVTPSNQKAKDAK